MLALLIPGPNRFLLCLFDIHFAGGLLQMFLAYHLNFYLAKIIGQEDIKSMGKYINGNWLLRNGVLGQQVLYTATVITGATFWFLNSFF